MSNTYEKVGEKYIELINLVKETFYFESEDLNDLLKKEIQKIRKEKEL